MIAVMKRSAVEIESKATRFKPGFLESYSALPWGPTVHNLCYLLFIELDQRKIRKETITKMNENNEKEGERMETNRRKLKWCRRK
jgi:hypothetical protein